MNKSEIIIKEKSIPYEIRRKKGNRHLRLTVHSDGRFVVSAPRWYPLYRIRRFIENKSSWIADKIQNVDFDKLEKKRKFIGAEYKKRKKEARQIIENSINILNNNSQFSFNRIAIRNQKSCWGSCSRKKNLNFNWQVAFLPEELKNYIIIHELCHLEELSHSQKFWKLVESLVPEYKQLRKKLKNHSV
ncbi:MAG: DUF45 domain-containing protein [Candidatus Moranbacteria bacterium]|nr:DUF45 domain-containing protein [Candidatus Moranbacteria bacterium]